MLKLTAAQFAKMKAKGAKKLSGIHAELGLLQEELDSTGTVLTMAWGGEETLNTNTQLLSTICAHVDLEDIGISEDGSEDGREDGSEDGREDIGIGEDGSDDSESGDDFRGDSDADDDSVRNSLTLNRPDMHPDIVVTDDPDQPGRSVVSVKDGAKLEVDVDVVAKAVTQSQSEFQSEAARVKHYKEAKIALRNERKRLVAKALKRKQSALAAATEALMRDHPEPSEEDVSSRVLAAAMSKYVTIIMRAFFGAGLPVNSWYRYETSVHRTRLRGIRGQMKQLPQPLRKAVKLAMLQYQKELYDDLPRPFGVETVYRVVTNAYKTLTNRKIRKEASASKPKGKAPAKKKSANANPND